MTSYDVVSALLRRWWFLLAVFAAAVVAVGMVLVRPPIYWASYDLNLVAPDGSGEVYSRENPPAGVTPVAGVLEILLSGNHPGPGAATQEVPIFGLEHRYGVDVRAKDKGLQWSRDYVAALTVQISEPTREAVLARADSLAGQAREALVTVQDDHAVPMDSRLVLDAPQAIQVVEIQPSRMRAAAAGAVLALGASIVSTILLDRRLLRRQRRRHPVATAA